MDNLHYFRKSIISGIRAFIISFILVLMFNLSIFYKENLMNFFYILIICFICSFMVGTSIFVIVYSKTMKNLKQVAALIAIITCILIGFLEYPFVDYVINHPMDKQQGEIKITIGKIQYIEQPENINSRVTIDIG